MVTVNITLDDDVVDRLRALAARSGRTIDEVASELLGSLSNDGALELSDAEERELEEADAEIDRGDYVTSDDLLAKLKAQRK